jgi:hypothetical protein
VAKKKPRGKTTFWQWLLIAAAAFLLYQLIQHYLPGKKPAPKPPPPKPVKEAPKPRAEERAPTPSPQALREPAGKWDFQTAGRLLPAGAYADNYAAIPLGDSTSGLLAYAKTLPGKTPGRQGLTNTQPGISLFQWNQDKYQPHELNFSELETLPGVKAQRFTGLPQIEKKPIIGGKVQVFSVKVFMGEDPRKVQAYALVDKTGLTWAPLQRADGSKTTAAFMKGTTRDTTRDVKVEQHDGKTYLIQETGRLDPLKPYEGYRWKVEAFGWDGSAFVFDRKYSETLTKGKQTN